MQKEISPNRMHAAFPRSRANRWAAQRLDTYIESGLWLANTNFDAVAHLLRNEWSKEEQDAVLMEDTLSLLRCVNRGIGAWLLQHAAEDRPLLPDELAVLVNRITCQHRSDLLLLSRNDGSPQDRYFCPLWESRFLALNLNVWMIAPTPDHDHGNSVGALRVLRGCLREEVWDADHEQWRCSLYSEGAGCSFGNRIHRIANAALPLASCSLHAYSGEEGGLDNFSVYRRGRKGHPLFDRTFRKRQSAFVEDSKAAVG